MKKGGDTALSAESHGYAMTPDELCQALRLRKWTFMRLQAAGKFDRFELLPRLGVRTHRYSRKAVQAFLDRDGLLVDALRRVR